MISDREILLGYCWLAVLMRVLPVTSGLSYACRIEAKDFNGISCKNMMNRKGSKSSYCIIEIIESRSQYDSSIYNALTKLSDQYCSGVDLKMKTQCSACFQGAFKDHWYQHDCLEYNKYRIPEVKQCLRTYQNDEFIWSRRIIFDGKFETVNLLDDMYNECKELIDQLGNKTCITLPVNLKLIEEVNDNYLTVFISLMLNAFKNQNVNNSYAVTCQDIMDTKILQKYEALGKVEVKHVPDEVQNTYKKLRASMCSDSNNKQLCEECFTNADTEFTFHLYNRDYKDKSMKEEFQSINVNYSECIQAFIGSRYSSLKNSIAHSPTTWSVDFGNCVDRKSKSYLPMIQNNINPIKGIGENDNIIKSVSANYHAFLIYQQMNSSGQYDTCTDVANSRILCAAVQTLNSIQPFYNKEKSEFQERSLLASNLALCGIYQL